jgi:tRNA-dihydrouridine synthase
MKKSTQPYRFSIAPMMDWTDRHCRFFHRLLSRRARLYTEMLAARAVQSGAFGACLMREPELVGDCVAAMKARIKIPVTVKCRTGVDEQDPEAALGLLAGRVIAAGCDALIVHARKAWLEGLSPRENRDLPPLDYGLVHALKQRFPNVPVVLNGGLAALAEMRAELDHVDGVMVERASRRDAIRNEDIAFVLSDVCMPQLDGFELARMIRNHPHFQQTAIIFVSAVALTEPEWPPTLVIPPDWPKVAVWSAA